MATPKSGNKPANPESGSKTAKGSADKEQAARASTSGKSAGTGKRTGAADSVKARGEGGAGGRGSTRSAGRTKSAGKAAAGSGAKKGGSAAKGGKGRGKAGAKGASGLDREVRGFAREHAGGWSHDQWQGFLGRLGEQGHDVSDPDHIGTSLERERVRAVLAQKNIDGLGPKRRDAVAERFGRMWELRNARPEEIASGAGIPVDLARQVSEAVR